MHNFNGIYDVSLPFSNPELNIGEKTSVPKKSYQMNDLRKPYLVSLTFKYASSVANSNCFYGKNFFMNVQDMQNMATLF